MSDVGNIAQLKMDSKTTLKASDIHVHDFSFAAPSQAAVGGDMLERIAAAARTEVSAGSSSLKMGVVDVDFDGLRIDLGDEGPEEAKLRAAKQCIAKEEYQPALGLLAEALELAPHHHEAIYLQAYCHHKLGATEAALRTLLLLRDANLTNRLRTRVQSLKGDIRAVSVPRAAKLYTQAIKSQQVTAALQTLQQFAEWDPEVGKFHYFVAGLSIVSRQITRAREAIMRGLEVCTTDRQELEELRIQLEQQYVPQLLGPARNAFRGGNHAEAARQLKALPEEVQQLPLARSFLKYLELQSAPAATKPGFLARFINGGLSSKTLEPSAARELNELFEFLAAPEMQMAREALAREDLSAAEATLRAAVQFLPQFTTANHMLAACIYKWAAAVVQEKVGTDLDDAGANQLRQCQQQLGQAAAYAQAACRDPALKDGQRLLQSIEEMRRDIAKVVQTHEDKSHDATIINRMIDELIPLLVKVIMLNDALSAQNIYTARQLAEELFAGLKHAQGVLPKLRRSCKTDQAREIADLIRKNFVDPNFEILRQAMNR